MKRQFALFTLLLAVAAIAQAHFVFVVPDGNGTGVKVIMSEDLKPTEEVDEGLIGGTKLKLRDAQGSDTALTLTKARNAYETDLPGGGQRLIHGVTDLGIMQRGTGKPHVLIYYPKTILGNAFDAKAAVGGETPVEIIPAGKPGAVTLKLQARGKPLPNSEITVILPDGTQKVVKTNESGQTEVFSQSGRFGAWARFWESNAGEREGKKYEELRHYATLVFDAPDAGARFATLPQSTSSFGAVESDGWLYVYGGHISPTHTYWTEAVSGRFHRLNLKSGKWEELPSGPALQGMNLTAHAGKIYRVGGMAPRNKRGAAADNHSTAECSRFDPTTGKWEALPPLPQARSSHDVVVVGNQLIVAGGWNMKGPEQEWVDSLAILDLSQKRLEWKTVPEPFRRRALISAAYRDRLYVIGGFNDKNEIVRKVAVYDPKTGNWSEGPELPDGPGRAFAPAAVVHQNNLYASVSDGTLLRLNEASKTWEKAGSGTGRVAHRLVSYADKVLVIGGAASGKNFDLIEAISVAR